MSVSIVNYLDSSTFAGETSTVVSKPSGVQDGDLLVVQVGAATAVGGNISSVPSGWTLLQSSSAAGGSNVIQHVYWKIASSEPSSWTWTWDAAGFDKSGMCVAFRTIDPNAAISVSGQAGVANSSTPSFANTITPTIENSMIVMFIRGADRTGTYGSYAISNDNPTWSELFEVDNGANLIAVATAFRPQTTATGNSSGAYSSGGGQDTTSIIFAINPHEDISQIDTVVSSEAITVLKSLVSNISDAVTSSENITSLALRVWNKVTKPSNIWNNQDKP